MKKQAYSHIKGFFVGFLLCYFLMGISLKAVVPILDVHSDNSQIDNEFKNIYQNMQSSSFDIRTASPTVQNLNNGQIVLCKIGTVTNIFYRISDSTYSIQGFKN